MDFQTAHLWRELLGWGFPESNVFKRVMKDSTDWGKAFPQIHAEYVINSSWTLIYAVDSERQSNDSQFGMVLILDKHWFRNSFCNCRNSCHGRWQHRPGHRDRHHGNDFCSHCAAVQTAVMTMAASAMDIVAVMVASDILVQVAPLQNTANARVCEQFLSSNRELLGLPVV